MVMQEFKDQQVCVIGLGYVGLTLAVVMADVGFQVLGVEIRDEVCNALASGMAHFSEPGLEQRLQRVIRSGHFKFAKRIPFDVGCAVYIITVGTPLSADGKARMDMVQNVAREVALHLREGDLVIMRSTMKLGTTRSVVMPLLEAAGKQFDLAFCPERTLEGKALTELRQLPQIVGGSNAATVRASQLFSYLTPTVIRVSDLETAEMIKLIDNTHRDVAFAFANEVARACDAVGVSAAEVIQSGKLGYSRTNVPMPGLVGGPCLQKDPHIFAERLCELGFEPEITLAARRINERQPSEIVSYLKQIATTLSGFPDKPVISFLGIAFKGQPATDDLRGTMAKPVMDEIRAKFSYATLRGFDAELASEDIKSFGLDPVASLEEAFKGASLVLILNNHPLFLAMPIEILSQQMMEVGVIYDFWNCFNRDELHLPERVEYVALGSHGKTKFATGIK